MNPNLFRYIWLHSRPDQVRILLVVLASLPFYFASFDVPKRIINDAIQGKPFAEGATTTTALGIRLPLPAFLGGPWTLFDGVTVTQLQLLWLLSLLFLTLVIVNGAFKNYINLSKGVLGERMLRRMRYELFALFLRFRPEDIRAVKPAEAATIIKDEVEPIGDFVGDAFIQPAFLSMQALTAMLFIMVQSFWLGLVALAVVLIQAFVIPALRKELIRLARERQVASRKLSGRIGEIVETAPAIHAIGVADHARADIGGRLGELFVIRVQLFRRKFAVKYLNNLLAQITPFLFYAIGGYLALSGSLNIGQLVAVIAAYRDLPPPIKELIDWDQQRADVIVKYQQILTQFPTRLLPEEQAGPDGLAATLASPAPFRFEGFRVADGRGVALLDSLTLEIARPSHVALVGSSGSGRDIVARALGRQLSEAKGKLAIGPHALLAMPDKAAASVVGYVGPEPQLFSGTIRENVVFALQRVRPELPFDGIDSTELQRRVEAVRSGNPAALPSPLWLDLEAAGAASETALDDVAVKLLFRFGMGDDIYRFGLLGQLDADRDAGLIARLPEARRCIGEQLKEPGLERLVTQFDPDRFNRNASLGENLLFGLPVGERLNHNNLGQDPYVRSILQAESLLGPLAGVGQRMAEAVIEIFTDLPPGHPLFERFSVIQAEDMPEFKRIAELARQEGVTRLSPALQARLIGLALSYNEQRHRMKVLDDAFEKRVVRGRHSLRTYLPQPYKDDIAFHDVDTVTQQASIRDNILFGRISYGVANAETKVNELVRRTLREMGLEEALYAIGLGADVGPAGRLLQPRQRAIVALARGVIARPDALVLDGALSALSPAEARVVLAEMRAELTERTLLVTFADLAEAQGFDRALVFDGPRLSEDIAPDQADAARAEAAE
jgi:putative ABC transport system ATP-binding protein